MVLHFVCLLTGATLTHFVLRVCLSGSEKQRMTDLSERVKLFLYQSADRRSFQLAKRNPPVSLSRNKVGLKSATALASACCCSNASQEDSLRSSISRRICLNCLFAMSRSMLIQCLFPIYRNASSPSGISNEEIMFSIVACRSLGAAPSAYFVRSASNMHFSNVFTCSVQPIKTST